MHLDSSHSLPVVVFTTGHFGDGGQANVDSFLAGFLFDMVEMAVTCCYIYLNLQLPCVMKRVCLIIAICVYLHTERKIHSLHLHDAPP